MNANEMIFALALASNLDPEKHFHVAIGQLQKLGVVAFSAIYKIPCRDAVGADYWNAACLIRSRVPLEQVEILLKKLEADSGRVRPSHHISLDVDLIAWGEDLNNMQFNSKKMPLPIDVKIPMQELWPHALFSHPAHHYPVVYLDDCFSDVG